MLTAIYYIIKTGESWNPYDYEDNNTRSKRVLLKKSNVLEFLFNLVIDLMIYQKIKWNKFNVAIIFY